MRPCRAGAVLTEALLGLPAVTDVRGFGLLLGAELDGLDARLVAADCLAAGLVINGVTPTALRFAPSLLVTDDEIHEAVSILSTVLDAHAAARTERP